MVDRHICPSRRGAAGDNYRTDSSSLACLGVDVNQRNRWGAAPRKFQARKASKLFAFRCLTLKLSRPSVANRRAIRAVIMLDKNRLDDLRVDVNADPRLPSGPPSRLRSRGCPHLPSQARYHAGPIPIRRPEMMHQRPDGYAGSPPIRRYENARLFSTGN